MTLRIFSPVAVRFKDMGTQPTVRSSRKKTTCQIAIVHFSNMYLSGAHDVSQLSCSVLWINTQTQRAQKNKNKKKKQQSQVPATKLTFTFTFSGSDDSVSCQ